MNNPKPPLVAVRRADASDAAAIHSLGCVIPELRVTESEFASLGEVRAMIEHGVVLVAECGGAVAGFLVAQRDDPDRPQTGGRWCIVYIAVAPDMRRRGLADLLYARLTETIGPMGVAEVYAWAHPTSGVIEFLERQGYARGKACVYMTLPIGTAEGATPPASSDPRLAFACPTCGHGYALVLSSNMAPATLSATPATATACTIGPCDAPAAKDCAHGLCNAHCRDERLRGHAGCPNLARQGAFHWRDGWYFERTGDGAVRMAQGEFSLTIPDAEWQSIVGFVGAGIPASTDTKQRRDTPPAPVVCSRCQRGEPCPDAQAAPTLPIPPAGSEGRVPLACPGCGQTMTATLTWDMAPAPSSTATDAPASTPPALLRTLVEAADHDQTPEEAHAELAADGVDVDAFVARVKRDIDAACLTNPAIVKLCHRLDKLDASDAPTVKALLLFWGKTKGNERRAREAASTPPAGAEWRLREAVRALLAFDLADGRCAPCGGTLPDHDAGCPVPEVQAALAASPSPAPTHDRKDQP